MKEKIQKRIDDLNAAVKSLKEEREHLAEQAQKIELRARELSAAILARNGALVELKKLIQEKPVLKPVKKDK